ncbi:MAG: uracil-DNA glycosylase [Betaproteobacteria bacterium]
MTQSNQFPASWMALLGSDARSRLADATSAAEQRAASGKSVFPARQNWFAAFHFVAPEAVKVVVLGQDPYPTAGNAMGLSFSVPRGVAVPASLRNIYIGLKNDLSIAPASHGDLRAWASQGVLLLNSVLTVEEGVPNSHAGLGWREVTDAVIAAIGGSASTPKSFLLWGAQAQKKIPLIATPQHLVLAAPHPSPLSARRGFFDCQHFSKANAFLAEHRLQSIDWKLPA